MTISKEYLEKLNAIKAKRPSTVIQHILQHGFITTEELKSQYGYDHPPRAARDVRELGIPLETFRVKDSKGRIIAAYRFYDSKEDLENTRKKHCGRIALDRKLKVTLLRENGSKDAITNLPMRKEDLQVDHRIPYEVGGESVERDVNDFQLVSASSNRKKSWACEHCPNWTEKNVEKCKTCFYAFPEKHEHIACQEGRILTVVFNPKDVKDYEILKKITNNKSEDKVKELIRDFINGEDGVDNI